MKIQFARQGVNSMCWTPLKTGKSAVLETKTNDDGKIEIKMVNCALKLGSSTTAQEICLETNANIHPPATTVDDTAQAPFPGEMKSH
jgi:hypothetical protein